MKENIFVVILEDIYDNMSSTFSDKFLIIYWIPNVF